MAGGGGMCGRGDIHGRGVHGRGVRAWQERWPLQQTVSIPLECILVNIMFEHHYRTAINPF